MKLLLLDLDGTVRESKSGATFINKPDDQKLIQGVEDAIAHYKDWTVVGITNQGGVAAGHKSLEDAIAEQQYTLNLLPQIQKIYFCSDFEGNEGYLVKPTGKVTKVENPKYLGSFRKPNPGMLLLAQDSCLDSIEEVLYVGDRAEDEAAALAAGIPFMWADQWRDQATVTAKS